MMVNLIPTYTFIKKKGPRNSDKTCLVYASLPVFSLRVAVSPRWLWTEHSGGAVEAVTIKTVAWG